MWITLWIDVDKPWISCGAHAIPLDFSCTILFLLGFSRPLCTQNPQNQHLSPSFVDKFADIVRFLLLCTRLCTMFDISVHHGILGEEQLGGARLRTRKVTGRDASLPAPLLSVFKMLVARGTVGALPQTPQGTLSLDPARGRRKGTKSPLDPFSRLSWSRFHAPSACSFCCFA